MAVKTVEMVRKIRDEQYKKMKELSMEEEIKFIEKKSTELQKRLKKSQRLNTSNTNYK